MSTSFQDRVVIITGAGGGLGRAHALAFAKHGATVVVNDFGRGAKSVADEICAAGGTAIGIEASVTDFDAVKHMVARVLETYGRIDALVNNAGILRDKTFAKMDLADFREVVDVHLMGAVNCTKAVWQHMRERKYGRIVMTTSSTGLYGNFGQSNYAAAKMALVGLTNTLALEGERDDIRVNCFAPTARTRMTEGVVPDAMLASFDPEATSAAVLYLASENAPTKAILNAGGGVFERTYVTMTEGIYLDPSQHDPDSFGAAFERISDRSAEIVPRDGSAQGQNELALRSRAVHQSARPT